MELNGWASSFIKGESVLVCTEEVTHIYPNGRRETLESCPVYESSVKKEESGEFYSILENEDKRPLYKYTFSNGRMYFEKPQAAPWLSGWVIFLALQDENGNWVEESLWKDVAIKAA